MIDICDKMKINRLLGLLCIISGMFLVSCERKENPIKLPEQGDAVYATVDMGEDYEDQIFFDFETNKIVYTSKINSWDLAFETGANGRNVFINGGADVSIYRTDEKNMADVIEPPAILAEDWGFDSPTGLPDSTYMNGWAEANGISKNEVYILKLNPSIYPDTFKKIQLISVDGSEYVIQHANLRSKMATKMVIPKDDNYNYTYVSLAEGGVIVNPAPPKKTWDIVFTRYRHIYYDLDNFPYIVTGAMLNPYNTSAFMDTTYSFKDVNEAVAADGKYLNHRNVIGFDWKYYNIEQGVYKVRSSRNYIIKNRNDAYWKLHFLDYYSKTGVKGAPSFEFQRIR